MDCHKDPPQFVVYGGLLPVAAEKSINRGACCNSWPLCLQSVALSFSEEAPNPRINRAVSTICRIIWKVKFYMKNCKNGSSYGSKELLRVVSAVVVELILKLQMLTGYLKWKLFVSTM